MATGNGYRSATTATVLSRCRRQSSRTNSPIRRRKRPLRRRITERPSTPNREREYKLMNILRANSTVERSGRTMWRTMFTSFYADILSDVERFQIVLPERSTVLFYLNVLLYTPYLPRT